MYGLVNQGLEDYIRQQFGDANWAAILARAGIDLDMFVALQSYPDDLTVRLIGAGSDLLGITPESLLEGFGEHWILYTAQAGYGDMLAMFGSTLQEFLFNLDNLHSHVTLSFPALRPPSFAVEPADSDDEIQVHYRSSRHGLAPFVVGLLRGLGKRFGQDLTIQHLQAASAQPPVHEVFKVVCTQPRPDASCKSRT
jgi:Haem-NO-binding